MAIRGAKLVISENAIPLRFQTAEVGVDWLQCNIECQEGCPVNTNCRGYLMLAAEGRFEEGYILARDPNPVAAICGYVCSAPCEKACRRADIDKPLATGGSDAAPLVRQVMSTYFAGG